MKVRELLEVSSVYREDLEFDNTFNIRICGKSCLIEPLFEDETISNKSFKKILENIDPELDAYAALDEFKSIGYPRLTSIQLNPDRQLILIDEYYN